MANAGVELTLPCAIEAEEAILGAMLMGGEGLNEVIDILKPAHFYKPEHQTIYKEITDLFMQGAEIDIITVANSLKQKGKLEEIGGISYLTLLTRKILTTGSIEHFAKIITDKYVLREFIKLAHFMNEKSYSGEFQTSELIEKIQQRFYEIIDITYKRETRPLSDMMNEYFEYLEKVRSGKTQLQGVPSGYTNLDRITGGFQNSDLIVIASRPGMGKTAFVLNMALNAARNGFPVAFFSIEMNAQQLLHRILAMETRLPHDKFRKITSLTDTDIEALEKASEKLKELPLYIDDTPGISLFELRTKVRRLKAQHKIGLVIVDYLQLIHIPEKHGMTREQEVSLISRSLKQIAKEINIPVIAVSQLNREVEKRRDYRPMLSDLRESGAIEQDADMIIFLYRPEYYRIKEIQDPSGNIISVPKGYTEVIIAKYRHGPTDTIILTYLDKFNIFEEPELASTGYMVMPSRSTSPSTETGEPF